MSRRRKSWIVALGFPALAIAALIAANSIDEAQSPATAELFSRRAVPFVPESGWALFAGFHAPAGEEPRAFAAGLQQVAAKRKAGGKAAAGPLPLELRAADELLCVPQSEDCLLKYAQRPEAVADLAADNAVLLARYDELLRSGQLADVVAVFDYYEAVIPHFSTVLRVQQVRLGQVAVSHSAGRTDEAIAWLEADAAFHRRWLEEAGSILTKMLAVRTLSRDFLLAGQIARSERKLSPAHWAALERVVAPLTQAQRGMAPVIRMEAQLLAGILDEMIADSRTTSRIVESPRLATAVAAATMRRNATLNFAQPHFAAWMELDGVASVRIADAIQDTEARVQRHLERDWRWAYNYTGRAVVAEARPQLAEYVYRVRDTDALASVVRCAIVLRRDGVARAAAAARVASAPECVDPYEGKALGWDAERGEISYRARSPKQVSRFGGRGERVEFAAY